MTKIHRFLVGKTAVANIGLALLVLLAFTLPSFYSPQITYGQGSKAAEACKDIKTTAVGDIDATEHCRGGYNAGAAGTPSKAARCASLSNLNGPGGTVSAREACERGYDMGAEDEGRSGGAGGDTSSAAGEEEAQADCDFQFSSPMSWIACPVIDMGVNTTDYIFEKIIKPMLEDVPISTNPEDGSYIAWSQFRLIANLLLVISLLAIVYSQAKGGK